MQDNNPVNVIGCKFVGGKPVYPLYRRTSTISMKWKKNALGFALAAYDNNVILTDAHGKNILYKDV